MEKDFTQLCVWPGTVLGDSTPKDLEDFFLNEMGVRVKYHTEVETLPDVENGKAVPDTGGRNDLFFFVHNDDIPKFAVPRLQMGIRWWEDVIVYNDNKNLYTDQFLEANPPTW
jgi:hypothetical protein